MARTSIRRQFLTVSLASSVLAIVLFVAASLVIMLVDDADEEIGHGDSFQHESLELIGFAMAIAAPAALVAAGIGAMVLSRRSARPIEDAIRAARETTARDLRRTVPLPERNDELRDLVVALNELFARLDDGFGALARFAADASHELRTPVAIMATELEIALRHPRTVDEWEATGRNALLELQRLASLVEGLLTLARADADAPAARISIAVGERVDAVLAQLADMAERAGVTLQGPVDEVHERVSCNPVMLETAIRNLVENAIQAVARGGHVRVGTGADSNGIEITVDDDGPGVGDDPEPLFAPFRRGTSRADTQLRSRGVGLGLAIARRVVTSHGGTLTATASPLGGARFTTRLPRTS